MGRVDDGKADGQGRGMLVGCGGSKVMGVGSWDGQLDE